MGINLTTDFDKRVRERVNYRERYPLCYINDTAYVAIIEIIKHQTNVDLTGYRQGVAARRIARRIRANGCRSVEEYKKLLGRNPEEVSKLLRLITIQVSQFFRNPDVYEAIERIVFPSLFQKEKKSSLIWSVGCAEGEEAYSVAILLLEKYGQKLKHQAVNIIATDVNEEAIKIARWGGYNKKRLVWVDDSLLRRYFRFKDGAYEVKNIVREIVEFRSSDVLQESDIGGADVVMLRNLLIYFDKARQDEILKRIDKALKSGGFLVLGKSETIPVWMRDSYQAVAFRERIYRKV